MSIEYIPKDSNKRDLNFNVIENVELAKKILEISNIVVYKDNDMMIILNLERKMLDVYVWCHDYDYKYRWIFSNRLMKSLSSSTLEDTIQKILSDKEKFFKIR